jgi:hypothetical protein
LRNGYILCGLAPDAAHLLLAADGLPPAYVVTTDWSTFPAIERPRLLLEGCYFLLRVPGNATGLFVALEGMMDVALVHRDGYAGLENHRLLLEAVTEIRNDAADRVLVNFSLSPERQRLMEMERYQADQAEWWSAHLRCLEDPGCADVFRRGR